MSKQLQQRLANEAARIMTDDGVTDIGVAKKKAMQRLGVQDKHLSPDNIDIESALSSYQKLFQPDKLTIRLHDFREIAKNAMQMLEDYSPRLVGSVLRGTATESDYVSLHVFTDSPEEIHFLLTDRQIPFVTDECQYQQTKNRTITCPVCRFFAGDVEVKLSIFSYIGLRQAPLSKIDEKPMKRADLASVKKLISG